jgi:hypothetical protein
MSLTLWQPKSEKADPLPTEWVEALFKKIAARYGSLFADRFGAVPHKLLVEEWGSELAGYTGAEIKRGLDGLRGCKFPPTLPEFAELCRPGIDVQAAFIEAQNNMGQRERGGNPDWSHPAIYWAAVEYGTYDLRHASFSPGPQTKWARLLREQLERGAWEPIPEALMALPAPKDAHVMPPEVADKLRSLVDRMRITPAA